MTAVSVIVPARDSAATLSRTLSALSAQELDGSFEVIVVDDGSSDATAEIAEAAGAPVRCVRQPALGRSHARNRGVEESSAPVLAFTDADCYPEPGWLAAGLRAMEGSTLVQGAVRPDPGARMGAYDRSLWVERQLGLWETANLFVTRESFDRAGGFEDWLRPRVGRARDDEATMAEDVWLGWRLRRAGARSAFCADALVYHAVFPRPAREYVSERRRLAHFPEMVAKMPELRETLCFRRLFLDSRSAAFDAAVLGAALALATRRPGALLAAVPYALHAERRARAHRRSAPLVVGVDLVADGVGLLSLVRGSVTARKLLL